MHNEPLKIPLSLHYYGSQLIIPSRRDKMVYLSMLLLLMKIMVKEVLNIFFQRHHNTALLIRLRQTLGRYTNLFYITLKLPFFGTLLNV